MSQASEISPISECKAQANTEFQKILKWWCRNSRKLPLYKSEHLLNTMTFKEDKTMTVKIKVIYNLNFQKHPQDFKVYQN